MILTKEQELDKHPQEIQKEQMDIMKDIQEVEAIIFKMF